MVVGAGGLWRTLGLAALSGLLLAGALPNLDWGWMAWFALVPVPEHVSRFGTREPPSAHGVTLAVFYSLRHGRTGSASSRRISSARP